MLFRILPNINNRATHCFIRSIMAGHFPSLERWASDRPPYGATVMKAPQYVTLSPLNHRRIHAMLTVID